MYARETWALLAKGSKIIQELRVIKRKSFIKYDKLKPVIKQENKY
jgi:hypothetical protein